MILPLFFYKFDCRMSIKYLREVNNNNCTELFNLYVVTLRIISLCQTNDSLHIHTIRHKSTETEDV